MKVCHPISLGVVGSILLFSLMLTACVNHISEEEGVIVNNGDIPLKFIANIHEATPTRVANNSFEEGDAVGLFALASNTTLQEERYIDNFHFVRSSAGDFVSDESVYYPDDGVTLNIISYYPYQEEGIAMGESTMPVSVETNQATPANYAHSDFLVATKEDVAASKEAIPLTYKHKFFRLKLALAPGEGEDLETMLASNPEISVSGFYTKTIYDFQKQSYSSYSEEKTLTPFGEWQIKEERLAGKELILIPQELEAGHQYILIEVNGKPYFSFLPSTLQLAESKQRELEITFESAEDILMSKLNGEIDDWEGTDIDYTESATLHKYVDIPQLAFEKSNIYKVLYAGKQVAEICKEYLVTPDFSSQAIVAYPMKEDATVDLSQGMVVQLLGQSAKVHGGSVSWNEDDHSLTYIAGTSAPSKKVYIMANGQISLSITIGDDVLPVLALYDVARDVRGGMIHNYPLVKIGTQYWMRSNLEASLYIDGNEIPQLTAVTPNAIGYLQSASHYSFYTAKMVLADNFLPAHWAIPNWEDWKLLKAYLKDDASLLKSGTWKPLKEGDTPPPATNLSGFNGLPVGMYVETFQASYENKHLSYWTLNDSNTGIAPKAFYMGSGTNVIEESTANVDTKAFAIRCIRK